MSNTITIPGVGALDAAQVAAILGYAKEQETKAANEAKAKREQSRVLVGTFVAQVVTELDEQTFQSGAHGYSLGGSKFVVAGKSYRVSVLIRDEATIPPKEEA